jgi:hypothetical protein
MLQILEEAKGVSEEPISLEEREELRSLKEKHGKLRDRAAKSHGSKSSAASGSIGDARSCSDDS